MLKKFKTYVLLAIFGVVVGSSQGLQAKWINIETEWGSEGWWFEPSLGDKKATLRRLTKNNAPIKELEKLAAEIHKMDSSFLKVFSSLCYFQANLKILPKKLEGLFDEKTGTFMTPGAAKLLGVQPVSTLKKVRKKERIILILLYILKSGMRVMLGRCTKPSSASVPMAMTRSK